MNAQIYATYIHVLRSAYMLGKCFLQNGLFVFDSNKNFFNQKKRQYGSSGKVSWVGLSAI